MVDALASEYGWSVEYSMDLPCDVVGMLIHAMLARKGLPVRLETIERDNTAGTLSERLESIWGEIDKDK